MSFIIAKKGARKSEVTVKISRNIRSITFSPGFFRNYPINLGNENYIRFAYDSESKRIAFEFLNTNANDSECLKLTLTKSKTSASCSVNAILSTFSISIDSIYGTYTKEAIVGPVEIKDFSNKGYIIDIKARKV